MKQGFIFASLLALSAPNWAGILDDNEARKAILELRGEMRQRDSENLARDLDHTRKIQALSDQLDTLGRAAAVSNAKLASDLTDSRKEQGKLDEKVSEKINEKQKDFDRQLDALRSTVVDLNAALSRLKEDNAQLRGQLEVAANNQQNAAKSQANEQQAATRRLQILETDLDARLKKLEPRTVAVDGKEALVDRAEESSFNAALNQFKATDYKSAARAFETFVAQYPQSGLQPSAQFWLGNSQFAAKDSKSALATLQNMMQKFPQHPRAPDAYLTMGHCYEDMNDKKRSAELYTYVISAFPNSPQAQVAQESLPKKAPPAPPKKR
jgi:tol-pal system protein YbgF